MVSWLRRVEIPRERRLGACVPGTGVSSQAASVEDRLLEVVVGAMRGRREQDGTSELENGVDATWGLSNPSQRSYITIKNFSGTRNRTGTVPVFPLAFCR